jgi:hypothetical protein
VFKPLGRKERVNATTSEINIKLSELDSDSNVFSKKVVEVAPDGGIRNALPLIRDLNRVHQVSLGLNALLALVNRSNEAEDADEPALSRYTTSALLGMAEEVTLMIAQDIQRTSAWTSCYGITSGGAA